MTPAYALPRSRPMPPLGLPRALRRAIGITIALATLLTNAGKAILTNLGTGLGGTVAQYVGWGTGAGTTAATDTTLFTEDSGGSPAYARVAATITRVTTTTTNDTMQFVATLTANAAKTITNIGNFDAATVGNLMVKGDFTGIPLSTGDSITATIKCQLT